MPELSKREMGTQNARRLRVYLKRAKENGTLPIHKGRVHKSKVAQELGFGRSVWSQNPRCKEILAEFEAEHLEAAEVQPQNRSASDRRSRELEKRVAQLERRLATVEAENTDLKAELRRLGWVDKHLPEIGRLPW